MRWVGAIGGAAVILLAVASLALGRSDAATNPAEGRARADLNCDGMAGPDDVLVLLKSTLEPTVSVPDGCTDPSSPAVTECLITDNVSAALPEPMNLEADLMYDNGGPFVALDWTDQSDDETCFVVEQSHPIDGGWDVAGVAPANAQSCIDWAVYLPGTGAYYVTYRVSAANATSRSDYSNESTFIFEILPTPSPLSPTPTPASPTPTPQPNGVQCDGGSVSPRPLQRGDFDCDKQVRTPDALLLFRWLLDLDPNIRAGCPSPDSLVASAA